MKKIFLACMAIGFSLAVNAQSDSTGSKMSTPGTIKNSDADPANRSRVNSDQENKRDQNQDVKSNTAPVQNPRIINDGNTVGDSAAMPKTITPATTPVRPTPVKPKAAVKTDKDKMYLVPDSTIKK